jgi:DNA repair protein RadA/Sms
MKNKVEYVCINCGYKSPKWLGKCPNCNEWESFEEKSSFQQPTKKQNTSYVVRNITQRDIKEESRFKTGISELDLTLGGGIVLGSLVLVGGNPGIGKSTLLMQMSSSICNLGKTVLYISGEESFIQISLRAQRLSLHNESFLVLNDTNIFNIDEAIDVHKPDVVIVDSIQTIFRPDINSPPGSIIQLREATDSLMRIAKGKNIATFIVGHVTKSGTIAGPKLLEHMVDTVLYFEGESDSIHRILRSEKNRFGSTNEVGIFEMVSKGLVEVKNPSEIFLSNTINDFHSFSIFPSLEGNRVLLLEIQSLVSKTSFPAPRRVGQGIEYNKIVMFTALIEKKLGATLFTEDIYINVVGGLKINEPALDLALILAIYSGYLQRPIGNKTAVFGEVGLLGEVRRVNQSEKRVQELIRMGFERVVVPFGSIDKKKFSKDIKIIEVKDIEEAINKVLKN